MSSISGVWQLGFHGCTDRAKHSSQNPSYGYCARSKSASRACVTQDQNFFRQSSEADVVIGLINSALLFFKRKDFMIN